MGTLIDTSILVAIERGQLEPDAALGFGDPETPVVIAAVTAAELLYGVYRSSGAQRLATERYCQAWLALFPVIPFDLEVARVHAMLTHDLRRQGTPIGAHDLIIAATAVSGGYRVATRDRRRFHRVEGLELQYW